MIIDNLQFSEHYDSLGERFAAAFAFLRSMDAASLAVGRRDLMGDDLYVSVQEYETQPEDAKRWESHRKYADIQYIASGGESMGWRPVEGLSLEEDLFADKDIAFYDQAPGAFIRMEPGMFAVFFPQDAHKPGCAADFPAKVRKILVKVALY